MSHCGYLLISILLFVTQSEGNMRLAELYRCILTRARGPCHENYTRWGWSVTQDKCISYNYSGCGGTENQFITRAECQKACGQLAK
ncbi:Protein ambp [Clonorchis sinensis]|uniref:Protein ambp n=1 Tax=Clonorchis sinensis TaxID=79923 RepID=A0A3R7CH71_CLOSI|nr:Protein ambp [Clonorchis sinensis]